MMRASTLIKPLDKTGIMPKTYVIVADCSGRVKDAVWQRECATDKLV